MLCDKRSAVLPGDGRPGDRFAGSKVRAAVSQLVDVSSSKNHPDKPSVENVLRDECEEAVAGWRVVSPAAKCECLPVSKGRSYHFECLEAEKMKEKRPVDASNSLAWRWAVERTLYRYVPNNGDYQRFKRKLECFASKKSNFGKGHFPSPQESINSMVSNIITQQQQGNKQSDGVYLKSGLSESKSQCIKSEKLLKSSSASSLPDLFFSVDWNEDFGKDDKLHMVDFPRKGKKHNIQVFWPHKFEDIVSRPKMLDSSEKILSEKKLQSATKYFGDGKEPREVDLKACFGVQPHKINSSGYDKNYNDIASAIKVLSCYKLRAESDGTLYAQDSFLKKPEITCHDGKRRKPDTNKRLSIKKRFLPEIFGKKVNLCDTDHRCL